MSSLHTPQSLLARLKPETGDAVFRHELIEEQAQSLGRAGRKVEETLAALKAHDNNDDRTVLMNAAADAVWGFLVQREIMGLRDRTAIVEQYGIPREIMARIGAR